MIIKGGKEITAVTAMGKVIAKVYAGARLVWEAVRSCFGKGWWVNDKPWNNEDGWKN